MDDLSGEGLGLSLLWTTCWVSRRLSRRQQRRQQVLQRRRRWWHGFPGWPFETMPRSRCRPPGWAVGLQACRQLERVAAAPRALSTTTSVQRGHGLVFFSPRAAATYPPQDAQELASAAEALATSCELLKDECPASSAASSGGGGGDGMQEQAEERAAAAAVALLAPLEAVQRAHRELAAELAAAAGDASAPGASAPTKGGEAQQQ